MFRQCRDCDFEWHETDGKVCPACGSDSMDAEFEDESDSAEQAEINEGGAFGSGPYANSQLSDGSCLSPADESGAKGFSNASRKS
jgi:RNA polymerase subunit RPABC4/transcription elongation factor Spt4